MKVTLRRSPKLGGYLLGVLEIRESYYLGVYLKGSPIFVK